MSVATFKTSFVHNNDVYLDESQTPIGKGSYGAVYSFKSKDGKELVVKKLMCDSKEECNEASWEETRVLNDNSCGLVPIISSDLPGFVVMPKLVPMTTKNLSNINVTNLYLNIRKALRCLTEKYVSYFDVKLENTLYDPERKVFVLGDRASRAARTDVSAPVATFMTRHLFETFGETIPVDNNQVQYFISSKKWNDAQKLEPQAWRERVQLCHDSLCALMLCMTFAKQEGLRTYQTLMVMHVHTTDPKKSFRQPSQVRNVKQDLKAYPVTEKALQHLYDEPKRTNYGYFT